LHRLLDGRVEPAMTAEGMAVPLERYTLGAMTAQDGGAT
jgi:hypothetical protein